MAGLQNSQMCTWAPTLEIKHLECEADHSPPSNAKVKKSLSYNFTSPIHRHGIVLIKQRIHLHGKVLH